MSKAELIETLVSYLPGMLLERIENNPRALGTPHTEELFAAAFFADISGFTNLTERLARQGPEGIEALSNILNDFF